MALPVYKEEKRTKRTLIAVASGKGGVGKSTVALTLARALNEMGRKVGLIDADIYGPSLSRMIPFEKPASYRENEALIPAQAEGMSIVSIGYLAKNEEPIAMRAPLANRMIEQFLNNTSWGDRELLIIDFPPGTGDIQMTLAQKAALAGAILVTTPQELAQEHVVRAAKMFSMLKVPLIGVVENMSYFQDSSGKKNALFGEGGGKKLANRLQISFLGEIPISPMLSRFGDLGFSPFRSESPELQEIQGIFSSIARALSFETSTELQSSALVDGKRLKLLWRDGTEQTISLPQLLAKCPCAKCQEGKGKESPISHDRAEVLAVKQVGRYALQFQVRNGCSEGLYSFDQLRGCLQS